ncbi:hypothetical protein CPSG_01694 [Coccidioides posadasii str. Silveira]|uniref:Uncharacterized protein n=1 Tax=Coccidioides posadasii (strain RMSCC 757 / Silveira) TaxID=443226 RepID=E9CW61_COCPS|nr:hypothetical protein CPSG_01694 [Coccidioides posadasii str. Silveira]
MIKSVLALAYRDYKQELIYMSSSEPNVTSDQRINNRSISGSSHSRQDAESLHLTFQNLFSHSWCRMIKPAGTWLPRFFHCSRVHSALSCHHILMIGHLSTILRSNRIPNRSSLAAATWEAGRKSGTPCPEWRNRGAAAITS